MSWFLLTTQRRNGTIVHSRRDRYRQTPARRRRSGIGSIANSADDGRATFALRAWVEDHLVAA